MAARGTQAARGARARRSPSGCQHRSSIRRRGGPWRGLLPKDRETRVTMGTILVGDDEKNCLWMLEELFQGEGYEVLTCERAEEALPLLAEGRVDLLLTDLRMAEMDGMALLGRVREMSPASSTIIMTAFGTVERAVEAMRLGAYDFILKPFNQADLLRTVAKALERTGLLRGNLRLSQTL